MTDAIELGTAGKASNPNDVPTNPKTTRRFIPKSRPMRIVCAVIVLVILAVVITAIVLVATARPPNVWAMSFVQPAQSWSLQQPNAPNPIAVSFFPARVYLAVNNPNIYAVDIQDMTVKVYPQGPRTPASLIASDAFAFAVAWGWANIPGGGVAETTDQRLNVSWPLTEEWASATLVKGLLDCGVEATKLPAYLVGKVNNELKNEALGMVKIVMQASKAVGVFGVRAAKDSMWMSSLPTRGLLCPETREDKAILANLGYLATLLNDAWHVSKNETGMN
ncbi:hypothetical protein GGF32_008402 [Allomyces javanicus]|nr:hypothetical protein GGF32_008402 [Allomyces javanicus]